MTTKFDRAKACEAIYDQMTGLHLNEDHECFEDMLLGTLDCAAAHPGEAVAAHEVIDHLEKLDSGRTFAFIWLDMQTYLGECGVSRKVSDVLAQLMAAAQKAGVVQ